MGRPRQHAHFLGCALLSPVEIAAGICQALYVVYLTVTQWVRMPPFNDLRHENKLVNAAIQTVLGIFAVGTLLGYRWALWCAMEWWVPYLTGWPTSALRRPRHETVGAENSSGRLTWPFVSESDRVARVA
jgi:hypothetical protein